MEKLCKNIIREDCDGYCANDKCLKLIINSKNRKVAFLLNFTTTTTNRVF